jgi:molecular chaperone HtpG
MANIHLPKRFNEKLALNQNLDGIVKLTLSSFGDILEENELYFFRGYTNHGIKHIIGVIESSDNFITDNTYLNILSDKDIGYYVLSVILHDIGMHIDLNGIQCLINGDFDDVQVKELDSYTWKFLWEDFLSESRKFSGKQLMAIFGNENTIVREPPFLKHGDITENDKKLIGEFIRRHHARLAHEIAIKGFPAKPNFLEFAKDLDEGERNLIGLIARSHGTDLRKCLDYIETKYGRDSRRVPYGIHAIYLMILLRIADYIQIDKSRTSKTILRTKTFASPVSEMEHNAHMSVDNIDYRWHDDPERIFVSASPKDSKLYLKLKKLIKDIQYELDISWAVLGELYGKGNDEDRARIKYRRITSNLEDTSFINNQNYVTDNFSFKANDEIIKLLVAPLYGNDPKYGVRELLQNAVDACRERQIHEKKRGNAYTPQIKIEIEKGSDDMDLFKITDNGIGMDIDVIKNYFLSAGASFRKSVDWQKEFLDEEGKSIVRRSGRFGVGILASFLIGENISVETKKVGHSSGYKFNASINSDQINILIDPWVPDGTSIAIKISKSSSIQFRSFQDPERRELIWHEWYTLINPSVKYFMDKKEITPYKKLNPENLDELPAEWQAISSEGYEKIIWTYSQESTKTLFTCNGIVVPELGHSALDLGLISQRPQISVFDNNAILPLTLDRNSCSERLSFNNKLLEDIYKDIIAYLLLFEDQNYIEENKIYLKNNKLNHPGLKNEYTNFWEAFYGSNHYDSHPHNASIINQFLNTILVSKQGFILNYNFFIKKLKSINTLLFQVNSLSSDSIDLDLGDDFILLTENKLNSIPDYANAIEANNWNSTNNKFEEYNSRIYLKTEKYNYLFKSDKKRVSAWLKEMCHVQFDGKFGLTCLSIGDPKTSLISDTFLNQYSELIHFIREYEITCPYEGDTVLNGLLERYLGDDVIIPFSVSERKKKYPLAFQELSRYMKKYVSGKQVAK